MTPSREEKALRNIENKLDSVVKAQDNAAKEFRKVRRLLEQIAGAKVESLDEEREPNAESRIRFHGQ